MIKIINDESTVDVRQFCFFDKKHNSVYIVNGARHYAEALEILCPSLIGNIFLTREEMSKSLVQIGLTMSFDKEQK